MLSDLVRFGVSIEENLLEKYDEIIADSYDNRSEAIRDLIRDRIVQERKRSSEEEVMGSLTLLFNHHQRELTEKMLKIQHDYPHIFKSNLHMHVNHDYCLEVIIMQGKAHILREAGNRLIGLRGVQHGKLTITSTGEDFSHD